MSEPLTREEVAARIEKHARWLGDGMLDSREPIKDWLMLEQQLLATMDANAALQARVERREGVVEAARHGCAKCEGDRDDADVAMCAEIWGCGFAATRAAIAALDGEVAP